MKKFSLFLIIAGFIGFVSITSSCKKNEAPQTDDLTVSVDDAFAENTFDNVSSLTDEAYDLSKSSFKSSEESSFKSSEGRLFMSDCATVTLDTTSFPRTLTIDFGTENCLGNDGKYRRGKIIVNFTGRYREAGTIITTTFDNFFVNDNQVEGTKIVTNKGLNENGNMYWTMNTDGKITLANDSGTIQWNSQREREWFAGSDTPRDRWDDIYMITGTASGSRANGLNWTRTITKPLEHKLACRFIVSGTMSIKPEGRAERILDYGDGECDNLATVTVNGTTRTIHLRK